MTYYMELRRSEERGMEKGMEKGIEKGRLETLKSLVVAKLLSLKDAADVAGMSEEKFKKIAEL